MPVSWLSLPIFQVSDSTPGPRGNWSAISANSGSKDANSGNLIAQNRVIAIGSGNATGDGTASISAIGGIESGADGWFGGSMTVKQTLDTTGTARFRDAATFDTSITGGSLLLNSTANNALRILGGLQAAGRAAVDSLVVTNAASVGAGLTAAGQIAFTNTTPASRSDSAAVTVAGGLGVAGDIYGDGTLYTKGSVQGLASGSIEIGKSHFTSTADITPDKDLASIRTEGGAYIKLSQAIGGGLKACLGGTLPRFKVDTTSMVYSSDGLTPSYTFDGDAFTVNSTVPSVVIKSIKTATGKSTGALQVEGGGSFGGPVYFDKQLFIEGEIQAKNTVKIANQTTSSGILDGALVVGGGGGFGGSGHFGGHLVSGLVDASNANGPQSGALQSRGGLSVDKDSYLVGKLTVNDASVCTSTFEAVGNSIFRSDVNTIGSTTIGQTLLVNSDTSPTSFASPSALKVVGGSIIGGPQYVGGASFLKGLATLSYNSGNSQIRFSGPTSPHELGVTSVGDLKLVSPAATSQILQSDTLILSDATKTRLTCNAQSLIVDTSSSTSGLASASFKVSKGAIIGEALNVGGLFSVASDLEATSLTSASTVLAGGLSVKKQGLFGGKIRSFDTSDTSIVADGGLSVARSGSFLSSVNIVGALTGGASGMFAGALTANGTLFANSPNQSLDVSSGSAIIAGGAGIAKDINAGGALNLAGKATLKSDTEIRGNVRVTSVTDTTGNADGSFYTAGGAQIDKSLQVGGSVRILDKLIVRGEFIALGQRSKLDTINLTVKDNILLLNAGASGSADSGVGHQRGQIANDTLSGDVLNDTPYLSATLGSANNTATTVNLGNSASTIDDIYKDFVIAMRNGRGSGQVRFIKSYNGASKIATLYSSADQTAIVADDASALTIGLDLTTIPDGTTGYTLHDTVFGLTVLTSTAGAYGTGYLHGFSPTNPASLPNAKISRLAPLYASVVDASTALSGDKIIPHTNGSNITLNNSVRVSPTGDLNGVASINGANAPQVFTAIQVADNATSPAQGTPLTGATKTYGVYNYIIESMDGSGSYAAGVIAANQYTSTTSNPRAQVQLLTVFGTNGEQVQAGWVYGSIPYIYLTTSRTNATGAMIQYKVTLY